jgi:hypothetical protein
MKKGQAALEFLTTYGWAFLVILVMIAALAYFGVLNPQKYLPDKCIITTGLDCVDYQITATNLYLNITNNMATSLTSFLVNTSTFGCGAAVAIDSGATAGFSCTIDAATQAKMPTAGKGNKYKFALSATYVKTGSSYTKTAYGEVFATVN